MVFLRHYPFARFIRKVVNNGTGRPVAPFSLPDFHAVPAMSRCAQSYLRVNFDRKQAAVTLPAGRPPMFAKSARTTPGGTTDQCLAGFASELDWVGERFGGAMAVCDDLLLVVC